MDEADKATPVPEVTPEARAPEAPATGGLRHALYIFGVVTLIVGVIAAVMVTRKPKPTPAPVAVIVHEPAPHKDQERVEVRPTPVVIEPEVPAVREPEPTPEAAPAPPAVPDVEAIQAPSASAAVPHTVRKRTHRPRPRHRQVMEQREIGFWASFTRRAAEIARGPSK